MDVRTILVVAALVACVQADTITIFTGTSVKASIQTNQTGGGHSLVLERNGVSKVIAVLGHHAGALLNSRIVNNSVTLNFTNDVTVSLRGQEVTGTRKGYMMTVSWSAPKDVTLEDCVAHGSSQWYGGPQQKRQYWPINRLVLSNYSYVTKEADNCGIAEPYWLNSEGIFYFFDKKVPLFVDQNSRLQHTTCFIGLVYPPYSSNRTKNNLVYTIGIFDNVRTAHEYAVETFLKKPSGIPNEKMITYPIWSTWAKYKSNINHEVVLQFADEILSYGFSNASQYEIDDLWEICYGSQTVNTVTFPDMAGTIKSLKSKGYRVTMWTHPFINKGCDPWYTEAKSYGYIVSSESNDVETSWWNDNKTTTSYIDFTKQSASQWYIQRLKKLQSAIGVDSFKFDGGESSWSPQIPVLQGDIELQPNLITSEYVKSVAAFGDLVEVRTGYGTQYLPIFVRMIDKDSYWTFENGLPTLITTTLQMNMNGYPLVLPDMIGGNGYTGAPSKELFIRWLQATTFMPSLQFSYVPWDYDTETVVISRKYTSLHEQYAPTIIAACKSAVSYGTPVNAPLWWIAPTDSQTFDIWDQYLLGETIVVAPVLNEGGRSRDIYLPAGKWMDKGDKANIIEGPTWLRNYSAALDVLPFFVKVTVPSSQASLLASVVVMLTSLVTLFALI